MLKVITDKQTDRTKIISPWSIDPGAKQRLFICATAIAILLLLESSCKMMGQMLQSWILFHLWCLPDEICIWIFPTGNVPNKQVLCRLRIKDVTLGQALTNLVIFSVCKLAKCVVSSLKYDWSYVPLWARWSANWLVCWICSLMSHSKIFQFYMWRQIDLQAAWRLTYG